MNSAITILEKFDKMSLELLWKGMLAIFIAVAVIYLFVFIMNRIDKKKNKKKADINKL